MSIYGIGTQTAVQTGTANGASKSSGLNVQDFLTIMTAQLKNLDPLGEGNNDPGEYISQMAQFTILEQLNTLAESLNDVTSLSQQQMSFSLVGKTVTVNEGENEITGIVEKVKYREGQAYPVVGGIEYQLNQVTEVKGE